MPHPQPSIVRGSRLAVIAVSLAPLAHSQAQPEPPPPPEIVLKEALVIGPVGSSARSPIHTDAVEAMIVAGTWKTPTGGDTVALPDGKTQSWKPAAAGNDGWLAIPAGGYAAWTVLSPDQRVMILEASGHGMVYVGGVPRVGDPYEYGYVKLPIELNAGANDLLFRSGRRRLRARLVASPAEIFLNNGDLTVGDVLIGDKLESGGAAVVINATTRTLRGYALECEWGGAHTVTPVPDLLPLSIRKAAFDLNSTILTEPQDVDASLRLVPPTDSAPDGTRIGEPLKLRVGIRRETDKHKRTFLSKIDGSIQYYSVVPAHPKPGDAAQPGLVLSLHGASVEATSQANAYEHKDWCHIVCPTNRRPFGFDWEDWGRLDALEVLYDAENRLNTDPQRAYLTGHSMGGHGTWNVGVQFPDRFAAIAPSAGWISFWSYSGAARLDTSDPVLALLQRAASPSDTLSLSRNLLHNGVYILHGDADDNVPVEQARTMRQHLATFHPDFAYHEQPDAGHWWGDACVDWPPIFEFFARRSIPKDEDVRHVEFITSSPGVSSDCHWAMILSQNKCLAPSSIDITFDPATHRFTGKTDNVALLSFAHPSAVESGSPVAIELDGQTLESIPWPGPRPYLATRLYLSHESGSWTVFNDRPDLRKYPRRCGPFKEAFRRKVVFAYATRGTPEENAWSLAKARYDAETFWYRGNGSIDVVPDVALVEAASPFCLGNAAAMQDRNVILYGNADTSAAWDTLLKDSPIQVHRDAITVGDKRAEADDLACIFVRPRLDTHDASVGVVSGTGPAGLRLTDRLPYFVSGVAYPDWTIFAPSILQSGAPGIAACGFFGNDWSLQHGESAWRD